MKGESTLPVAAQRSSRLRYLLPALLVATVVLAWLLWPTTPEPAEPGVAANGNDATPRTVADNWQWHPVEETEPATVAQPRKAAATGRISPAAVVRALGRVQFDASGKVVVDRSARDILEDSLNTLPDLTEAELAALQATLRAGLPGPQGERVAKIVTDYYQYHAAVEEFELSSDSPTDVEGERTRLDYLARMREQYLGPVVARQLYAEDQAMQRYLLATRSGSEADTPALQKELQDGVFFLDSRTSTDAKELSQQMAQLRTQGASGEHAQYIQNQQLGLYTANALPRSDGEVSDWQQRYAQFKQERELVLGAGLAETDKQTQIEQLLVQYFTAAELEAIRVYDAR
jgi:lipase chaperone LimK